MGAGEGGGLGLPSHRGILMSFLARSDGAGRDGVMKTDDLRPALLIFLLEEGESQPGAWWGRACRESGRPLLWYPHLWTSPLPSVPPPCCCHRTPEEKE